MDILGVHVTVEDAPFISTGFSIYCLWVKTARRAEELFHQVMEAASPVREKDWIDERSITRCFVLLFPLVGNILVRIYDLFCHYYVEKKPSQNDKNSTVSEPVGADGMDKKVGDSTNIEEVKASLVEYFKNPLKRGLISNLRSSLSQTRKLQEIFDSLENSDHKKRFFEVFQSQIVKLDFSGKEHLQDLRLLGEVIQEDASKPQEGASYLVTRIPFAVLCLKGGEENLNGYLVNLFLKCRLRAVDRAAIVLQKKTEMRRTVEALSPFFNHEPESSQKSHLEIQSSIKSKIESKNQEIAPVISKGTATGNTPVKVRPETSNQGGGGASASSSQGGAVFPKTPDPQTSRKSVVRQDNSNGLTKTNPDNDRGSSEGGLDYSALFNLSSLTDDRLFSLLEETALEVTWEAVSLKVREEAHPDRVGLMNDIPFQLLCLSREENKGNLVNLFLNCRFKVIDEAETVEEALEEFARTEKALGAFLDNTSFGLQINEVVGELKAIQRSIKETIENKKKDLEKEQKDAEQLAEVE